MHTPPDFVLERDISLTLFGFFYRLQHTDVDVPHYSQDKHNFVKGALHSIDRPYDKLDPWGFIDFLHHKLAKQKAVFLAA